MVQVIEGCGKPIFDKKGQVIIACGDHIDTDYDYETGVQHIQPVLCDECWIIQNKLVVSGERVNGKEQMKGGISK